MEKKLCSTAVVVDDKILEVADENIYQMAIVTPQIDLIDRPGSRSQVFQAVFGPKHDVGQIDGLQEYFAYYSEELHLLCKGISRESWQTKRLAIKTCADLFHIVDILRLSADCQRPVIRQRISLPYPVADDEALNRSINLAIRLWLMINVQEPEFGNLRHEATFAQWNDESTLREFLHALFPHSRWPITAQSSRLGPHFTAAFMQRVCGLTIEWTTSLHDHLRLDRRRKAVRIFSYKSYLQALLDSQRDHHEKLR